LTLQYRYERKKANKIWWKRGRLGVILSKLGIGKNTNKQTTDVIQSTEGIKLEELADSGGVEAVYDAVGEGRRMITGEMGSGQFFGHLEILDQKKCQHSVVVIEPCVYYTLNREAVLHLIETHPGIALELQASLGQAILTATRDTIREKAKKAKVDFLNELKKKFKVRLLSAHAAAYSHLHL
jgi:signal-transduction protein with cAMP-binding, CBS, and nucleotidyltransferase domain